jgi:predicted ATPase
MIKQIEIKNFKSLKTADVNVSNLNLLMGLNGMGKSSFIQTLLLLMQSDKLEDGVIDLNGLLAKIGQGKDALYQFSEDDFIYLHLEFGFDSIEKIFEEYIENNNQRKTPERFAILKEIYSIEEAFDIDTLYLRMAKSSPTSKATLYNTINDLLIPSGLVIENKHKNNKAQFEKAIYNSFKWKFIYQTDKDKLISKMKYRKTAMTFFRSQTKNFQYLSAERIGPKDLYESSSIVVEDKKQLGLLGEFAAHYINVFGLEHIVGERLRHPSAKSEKLLAQINAWLTEISPGVSLNTKYVPEVNKVILDYQFDYSNQKTNSFRPKNVGFGISYVLPIVLALLTAEEGKIIVIENPESHIHPRGQAQLGKLISLAASIGAQLFVETHSDHILNGIRVAVKEGDIDKSKVNVMYFEKTTTEKEQFTKITQIKVDKNGTLSEYPKDFLDEWSNQLFKLM